MLLALGRIYHLPPVADSCRSECMTLTRFVTKNAFRNKRRSTLTVLSIAFSLLLLTLMMTIWRAFYLDQGSAESAQRLVVRHRVSLTFSLPGFYREKIRALPGVVSVVPVSWFGGIYKDQKPENFFAQFGTDPDEFFKTYRDAQMPEDQIKAWQRDRHQSQAAPMVSVFVRATSGALQLILFVQAASVRQRSTKTTKPT